MAGEAILANIVTEILKKLGSFTLEEINLARGVQKELEKLKDTILTIEAVIRDAENKQVKDEAVGVWLKKLKDLAYEADDILDEYAYDVMHRHHVLDRKRDKVSNFVSFSSNPIVLSSKKGRKIKNLNQKFDELARQRVGLGLQIVNVGSSSSHTMGVDGSHGINRETYAFVDESKVLGREVDKSNIINMLLANKSSCNQNDKISVIPIVGMGGLGKTTLAQLVYKDTVVESHFDLRIWVCVSDVFDVKKIFINIINSISDDKFDTGSDLNFIANKLQQCLGEKKFLLVLDDVWNEKDGEWNKLKNPLVVGAEGSKVLVTTRSENVASIVLAGEFPPYMLHTLREDICLSIFEQRAFGPSSRTIRTPILVEIGKELVRKCGGLPLAAEALGSLMRSKKEVSGWEVIRDSKIWDNYPENPNKILPALKLSYDHLSPQVKQCFSYCSMFPKDSLIHRETVIQLWVAEGFIQPSEGDERLMEEIGNGYFNNLLWNSFFQGVRTNEYGEITCCKIHDLIHDLAQSVAGTHECAIMEASEMGDISKFRRLNLLNLNEESSAPVVSKLLNISKSKLRTLFIKGGRIKGIVNDLLNSNKQLRVLDLSHSDIVELPPSIGDLKHLRYLDLSSTRIRSLPDSITRLYKLQTLKMYCKHLKKFPKDLNKLINMRHLYTHEDTDDWQGHVGQLTCLQTLNGYGGIEGSCVGSIYGGQLTCLQTLNGYGTYGEMNCLPSIGRLQCLNLLRGELKIIDLNRLFSRENAESANLIAKSYIQELSLAWINSSMVEGVNMTAERECREYYHDSLVLEGLQPHPNLRSLKIDGFMGPLFPTWMSNPSCLQNLVHLKINGCRRCKQLPSFEVLPSLRFLEIRNMLFLEEWSRSTGWSPPIVSSSFFSSPTPTSPTSSYYPSLESIKIYNSPNLKSMPTKFFSLKEFDVQKSSNGMIVSSLVRSNLDTLTKVSLWDVDGLKFLPQGLLKENNVLQSLTIGFCPDFRGFIQQVEGDEEDLLLSSSSSSSSLRELDLRNCPVLMLLPGDIRGLTSLRKLTIDGCWKLNVNHCGSNLMDTLTSLSLSRLPGLMFLPLGLLKGNNVLQTLSINYCPNFQGFIQEVEGDEDLSLSNSNRSRSSLRELYLRNCPVLRLLPDLKDLTSLRNVTIQGCNEELVIVLPNGVENRLKS